jgi:EpsI family protein
VAASQSAFEQASASIPRVKLSIDAVGTFQATRAPQFRFAGTGFVIGDGTIVATNAHVLPAVLEPGNTVMTFWPRLAICPSTCSFAPFPTLTIAITAPTPVHSMIASGSNGTSATLPEFPTVALANAPSTAQPGQWTPSAISGQRHVQALMRDGATPIQIDRVIFTDQRQGGELIGTDRHLGDSVAVLTDQVTAFSTLPMRLVRQAIVRHRDGVRLVWYWYRVAGVSTTQSMKAKLLEIPAGITGSPPSEFVAISTPCGPRDCADAARSLQAVLTRP